MSSDRDPDFFKLHYRQWKRRMHKLRVPHDLQGALLCVVIETHLTGAPPADDDYVLAGVLMVSPRKARAVLNKLLALGLVLIEGGLVVDHTAVEDATERSELRAIRAQAGHEGGVRSGKVRRARADLKAGSGGFASGKSLENNDHDEAKPPTTFELEKSREEKKERATDVAPKKTPASVLSPLLGSELAAGVVEHRQRLRKPMTVKAAELMLRQFEKCTEPIAGAEMMIERGWQGFKADWFRNDAIRQRTNGDDRHARKIEMATRQDRRGEADSGVDHDASGSDPVALLPAEHFGRS